MSAWSEKIVFDECMYDKELDTTIVYFTAPREYLSNPNPEDICAKIRIEYAFHGAPEECSQCEIMIGHTKESEDITTDYDWDFYDITQEQYEELIELYLENVNRYPVKYLD